MLLHLRRHGRLDDARGAPVPVDLLCAADSDLGDTLTHRLMHVALAIQPEGWHDQLFQRIRCDALAFRRRCQCLLDRRLSALPLNPQAQALHLCGRSPSWYQAERIEAAVAHPGGSRANARYLLKHRLGQVSDRADQLLALLQGAAPDKPAEDRDVLRMWRIVVDAGGGLEPADQPRLDGGPAQRCNVDLGTPQPCLRGCGRRRCQRVAQEIVPGGTWASGQYSKIGQHHIRPGFAGADRAHRSTIGQLIEAVRFAQILPTHPGRNPGEAYVVGQGPEPPTALLR